MSDQKNAIPRTIMLLLTEDCNLRCTYCYENHCKHREMTVDTAIKIIEDEMKNSDCDDLILDFFGGEPFLKFDVMKEVCEYVWARKWPKTYMFNASTNGTLIHGKIKDWLQENRHRFNCGISFDGNKYMQDINRCFSFDKIDLDFFAENWPEQTVKMTISPASLPQLAEGIVFLHEKKFRVSCNLAYGPDWSDKRLEGILSEELKKLVGYYCAHPEIEPCSMLNHDMVLVGQTDFEKNLHQYCGSGIYMSAYACDGEKYPCHMFMPIALGQKDWRKIDFKKEFSAQLINEECRLCTARNFCSSCAGFNFMASGDIHHKNTMTCNLDKLTFAATAGLAFMKFKRGQLSSLYEKYDLDISKMGDPQENVDYYYFCKGIRMWQSLIE